ncbi:MAG TPA: flavin reductase family protein [Actinomycetota bacterium]|nr:flavin reductase family protein [Actinomycetota bacterium]
MTSEEDFKNALRKFASGVTVVTVSSESGLHGMTASSFASVSLAPPLILVCIDKTSRTRELLSERGAFAVNVLAAGQEVVSRGFSRRGEKPFEDSGYAIGKSGAPLLSGTIAWLECDTHQIFDAGDHEIVIGAVRACSWVDTDPLIYFDGAYRSLT